MSLWTNMNLQDSNSSLMENLIMFHDHAMIIIMMILILILYILYFMAINKFVNRNMFEGQMIEIIWTLVPVLLLLFLVFPSLKILYLSDEISSPFISVKVLGHQWYWSYEYNDFDSVNFDSYMKSELEDFDYRLLDVDNRVVIPVNLNLRMMISSLDVIHSFAIPSIGVKVDAVPGRINQIMTNFNRPGIYYGQCSEICGVNHSFMPIVFECNSLKNFLSWIVNFE
uniref:cytochrome c oxidase subunit II n=1 Tax=Lamennaisia ambigua TaxID=3064205 RepID=UPI00286A80CC|nr:cytochrome c oxidase subunit II [Lamennaisia ambigua]WKV28903.1 cytochrome c oxidase subunit II [Lamennaisia ambigua]